MMIGTSFPPLVGGGHDTGDDFGNEIDYDFNLRVIHAVWSLDLRLMIPP